MPAASNRPPTERSSVVTTVRGGRIQGVAGAGTVYIENFQIYNSPLESVPQGRSAADAVPLCPYPGLAYFGPGDGDYFFGRNRATERLLQAVSRQSLTALIGASGSGKSSVVLAGLAPRLHQSGEWRFTHFRIGTELQREPFVALARALVPLYVWKKSDTERLKNIKQLASDLRSGELSLPDVFADCRNRNKNARILVVADQFEEAFTAIEDESVRSRFIEVLLDGFRKTGEKSPRICLILTLRADFYAQALQNRALVDALQDHTETLGPMNREELGAAIIKPAENVDVSFEAGIVETLLDDLERSPAALPLLQFALREMWQRQEKREIGRRSYDAIGGLRGAITKRAEAIFAAVSDNSANRDVESSFRRLFTRLVTLSEGQDPTRRVVSRKELNDAEWLLAQRLANEDNRLIVTNMLPSGSETAELVHEALIRNWPRLVQWLERDRDFQAWVRQIWQHVELWSLNPHDDGPLLRGSMLAVANEWLSTHFDDLSTGEQSLISASIALHERSTGERRVVERTKQVLHLSDLTDQVAVDLARTNKLRGFVSHVSNADFPYCKTLIRLHGEALGLDADNITREITEREALIRYESGAYISDASVSIVPKPRGMVIIASARSTEVAYSIPELGGSVFGRYFTEALEGRGADTNGFVTIGSAYNYVREHMRRMHLQQTPYLYTTTEAGSINDFPLTGTSEKLKQRGGRRRALLAATDKYNHVRHWDLPGQEASIRAVANVLSKSGAFETSVLVGAELTRSNLMKELNVLIAGMGANDCLLFYFAGHSYVYNDSPHLFLADSIVGRASSAVDPKQISTWGRTSHAGAVIIILDMSFAASTVAEFQ